MGGQQKVGSGRGWQALSLKRSYPTRLPLFLPPPPAHLSLFDLAITTLPSFSAYCPSQPTVPATPLLRTALWSVHRARYGLFCLVSSAHPAAGLGRHLGVWGSGCVSTLKRWELRRKAAAKERCSGTRRRVGCATAWRQSLCALAYKVLCSAGVMD